MGMLLHRHLLGATNAPKKVVEKEEKKEIVYDNKRKDNESKNANRRSKSN